MQFFLLTRQAAQSMSHLEEALSKLAKYDLDKLVAKFTESGFVGIPKNAADNPLAHYLRDAGLNVSACLGEAAAVQLHDDPTVLCIELPELLQQFNAGFHQGQFLSLIREQHRAQFAPKTDTPEGQPSEKLLLQAEKPRQRRRRTVKA